MTVLLHYKVVAYACIVVLFSLVSGDLTAQSPVPHHRVQAIIPDIRTARQAHDVDAAFRATPGVLMSRTDFNTRNLLIEVSPDCALSSQQAEAVLLPFELTLRCWSRTAPASRDFTPLDPRSCGELPVER